MTTQPSADWLDGLQQRQQNAPLTPMTADELWENEISRGKMEFPPSYEPLLRELAGRGWITLGPSAAFNKRGNITPAKITVGVILRSENMRVKNRG